MVNINYDKKIEELKNLFTAWSKRKISPIGKIVVIKTLALAKLNHLILSIPNPSQEKINSIQNLFFKFLWKNSNDKVKRTVITQDYNSGGLKMVDLSLFINSLKATWFRRLLSMNNKFSKLVEYTCPFIKNIGKYGADYIKINLRNNNINPFWKNTLNSYLTIYQSMKNISGQQYLTTNIWFNPDIKVGGSSICYKRWLAAGIVFIGDLLNQDGESYSYREFNNIYNIRTNFLEYNGLIAAIRRFVHEKNIQHVPPKHHGPVMPNVLKLICKDKKGCRGIYEQILKTGLSPKSLLKWKNELGIPPDSGIFSKGSIFEHVFRTTKDPKLMWFQYRINHRILGTNYLLKKMNIVVDDSCTFCRNAPETLLHLFYQCPISKEFLTQLFSYIQNKCNIELNERGVKDVIFGSHKLDKIQNLLLLQAKHFIYFNKINCQIPLIEVFKKRIKLFYRIEKFNATKCFQLSKFERTWDMYTALTQ